MCAIITSWFTGRLEVFCTSLSKELSQWNEILIQGTHAEYSYTLKMFCLPRWRCAWSTSLFGNAMFRFKCNLTEQNDSSPVSGFLSGPVSSSLDSPVRKFLIMMWYGWDKGSLLDSLSWYWDIFIQNYESNKPMLLLTVGRVRYFITTKKCKQIQHFRLGKNISFQ